MSAAYIPQPGSTAARAIAHLLTLGEGAEASSADLAAAISIDVNAISAFLSTPLNRRALLREKRDGRAYWRLGPRADAMPPPPAAVKQATSTEDDVEDLPPIARIIPSTTAAPIPGLMRQSWCPAAQAIGSESSLDEPPALPPLPPSPPAAPPGLGWKAPRIPVFLADAPAPATAAPEAARGAAAINDETVQALTAALSPPPAVDDLDVVDADFDPDFQEVAPAAGQAPPEHVHIELLPPDPAPAMPTTLAADDDEFRCALWSDGRLHIEPYPGNFVLLTKDETRQLVRYLDRMREPAE